MSTARRLILTASSSRHSFTVRKPSLVSGPASPIRYPSSVSNQTIRRHISKMASATNFYQFSPKDKKGSEFPLSTLQGKVVLVVNTASKCGFTPQFEGLEKLYKKIKEQYPEDFTILGFPCNQFGGQDPGSDDQIQEFCQLNYGVSFPVLGKTDVNGDKAEPVFKWLKQQKKSLMMERIKWNFEKFLIGRDGLVKERWASTSKPESLEARILEELKASKPSAAAGAAPVTAESEAAKPEL